jgi:ribosomal protein S4
MKIKRSRYKPLYKKFIRLRKNIQNRKKILTSFKSKKWYNLVSFLNNMLVRRKKNFRAYDLNQYFISRFSVSYKKKFLFNLLAKQRLSLFYGVLPEKYLKKLIRISKIECNNLKLLPSTLLIIYLEKRLDTVLYRSHFAKSLRESRLLIQHGHVYVNNLVVSTNMYQLKKGDIIQISSKYENTLKYNIFSSNLWPLPPKYLSINYKTFQIFYLDNLQLTNFSQYFPFSLELNSIVNYHKY